VVVVGVLVLLAGVNVVRLNVYIELMDALLLPMAVGFLYVLATGPQLPEGVRVEGRQKQFTPVVFALCVLFAVSAGIYSLRQDLRAFVW